MEKKKSKQNWVTIQVLEGSIVITPVEIKAFKKHGMDLLGALKVIQKEIYKKPKKK